MINNKEIIFLQNRYKIYLKNEIGRGKYGILYECQDLNNENPDIKLCAKITYLMEDNKSPSREFQLMSKLKQVAKGNPNIVGVIDVLVHDQQIVLIQERCECDLQKLIMEKRYQKKTFTPTEALEIIKQIANGYKVLLAHNIIHRDIKPQNILYVNNTYKIADFGLARVADRFGIHTKLGTPRYSAPQLFWDYQYTFQADIYSLGIIFYQLIFDSFPFPAKNQEELKNNLFLLKENPIKVSRDLPEFQQDDSIPILIEQMLLYEEKDRIDWTTLFKHKLINQFETQPTFQEKSLQEIQNQQISTTQQNINSQILLQNQIIPNNKPIIKKSNYHYQIGIFFTHIEQEVIKYMNTQHQFLNNLLYLRKILCNLAYIFFQTPKNQQQPFIEQQQQELNKLLTNQQNLEIEQRYNNLLYSKERLELQTLIIYIQEIKKQMDTNQMKYQRGKIYYYSYLRLQDYYMHYLKQSKHTKLIYTI